MKERPILFSAPMVKALLEGTKTQTRRALKPQPDIPPEWNEEKNVAEFFIADECVHTRSCPYGEPGDRIYVRETFFAFGRWETRFSEKKGRDEWHFIDMTSETGNSYLYASDGVRNTMAFIKRRGDVLPMYWKRPAIHMPRAASRILLEVVSVRVERLNEISEADALAEGITRENVIVGTYYANGHHEEYGDRCFFDGGDDEGYEAAEDAYAELWKSINGPGSWDANPWVWVVSFRRITA